ncbi:MAG: hypothetical protein K0R50_1928 [Eubacterium sp.]|nr:hypothetical protein [Eubacterium sp.]
MKISKNTIATIIFIAFMIICYFIYHKINFKNENNEFLFWTIIISVVLLVDLYSTIKIFIKNKNDNITIIKLIIVILTIVIFGYSVITKDFQKYILLILLLIQYFLTYLKNKKVKF